MCLECILMDSNSTPIIKLMCHSASQYWLCHQTLFPPPQREMEKSSLAMRDYYISMFICMKQICDHQDLHFINPGYTCNLHRMFAFSWPCCLTYLYSSSKNICSSIYYSMEHLYGFTTKMWLNIFKATVIKF